MCTSIMLNMKIKKIFIILIILLSISIILSTCLGSVNVPIDETIKILINNIFENDFYSVSESYNNIIFNVRLPRVIIGTLVGSGLAISGSAIQSVFRNPMADPGIIGISSGGSLGAIIAIALGLSSVSLYAIPIFAVIGAIVTSVIIYILSYQKGNDILILNLVLCGMAISIFLRGIISLILTFIDESQMAQYMFWSMGSLSDRRWEHVQLIAFPILVCMIILIYYGNDLNILLLGEEEAHSVGLNPQKSRRIILFLSAIITALAVSVSGGISFIGLIVPHIIRLIVGADNKVLLPASCLAGSVFLLMCDLVSRTLFSPLEISVGIVTSLVGAPYFIYLLNKNRKEGISL